MADNPKLFKVSDILDEMYGPAAVDQEDPEHPTRKMRQGWTPFLAANAVRLLGGIGSGVVGAVPSFATTPAAAAIAGGGEAAAQWIESPDDFDNKAIGIEAALGAVPFGKLVKTLKPGLSVGKQMLANAGRMAAFTEAGNMIRRKHATDHYLPQSLIEGAFDVGTMGLGAGLANLHPKFSNVPTDEIDELDRVLGTMDFSQPGKLIKPETLGGAYETAVTGKPSGLRVKAVEHPALSPENKAGNTRKMPSDPIQYAKETNVLHADKAEPLPANIEERLRLIDERPPSSRLQQMLNEEGKPATELAEQLAKHEAELKELQKRQILERHREQMDALKRQQEAAEVAADRENLRNQAGSTDLAKAQAAEGTQQTRNEAARNKFQEDVAKAQAAEGVQQTRNQIARDKFWQGEANAAEAVAKAEKQERARLAIAEAEKTMERSEPSITATSESVPTKLGKKTMRVTMRPKKAAEEGFDAPISPEPAPVEPRNSRPVIAKTDPDIVSKTVFSTRDAAMDAAAGSGRRVQQFQRMGRGKWRVIFEGESKPPTEPSAPTAPAPEPPKGPGPSGAPAGEAATPNAAPKFKLPVVKDPETKLQAAQRNGIGPTPVPESVHIESAQRLAERRLKAGTSPTGAERRAGVIEGEVNKPIPPPTKYKVEGKGMDAKIVKDVPPEAPPAAPVVAKPKPAPKKPSGGASVKPEVLVITTKATPSQPVGGPPAKPVEIAQKPAGAPVAPAKVPVAPKAAKPPTEAPKPVPEASQKPVADPVTMHPKGATIHAYGSEGTVLTHGPMGVRVKFTKGRMLKEQGQKGYFDVDPKHIETTEVPAKATPKTPAEAVTTSGKISPAERAAVTREDAANWSAEKLSAVKAAYPKDKRLQTILKDELEARSTGTTNQHTPAPAKAAEPAKPAESRPFPEYKGEKLSRSPGLYLTDAEAKVDYPKLKAVLADMTDEELAKERSDALKGSFDRLFGHNAKKMLNLVDNEIASRKPKSSEINSANVKPQAAAPKSDPVGPTPTKVTVNLTGAKNSAEVKNRVLVELQKYKQQVDAAGPDYVEQATMKTVSPREQIKPLTIEVPNGPTYTVRSDQVDGAIQRLEKGLTSKGYEGHGRVENISPDDAFKGIVDKAERPTHVKVSTGYGSNFSAKEGSAPSVKLPIGPEPPPTGGGTKPAPKKGMRVVASKRPTTGSTEGGPKAESRPLGESKPTEGTGKLADLALKEKEAWDHYHDVVKQGVKAGTHTPEELRAAGKAAGELRAELAKAVKEAQAKGEPIPTFLQKQTDAPPPKATVPPGKGPTNEDIARMPPEQQESALKAIVDEFKKRGRTKNQKGEFTTELALHAGLSVAGAMAGAAMTPDDPLTGAIIGGGLGLAPMAVYRTLSNHINSLPANSAGKSQEALSKYVSDKLKVFAEVLPDAYRASLLSRPEGLLVNSFVGPYGAAIMGSIEHAIAGDKRGLNALKELLHPTTFTKEWFSKKVRDEAKLRVFSSSERADMRGGKGPKALQWAMKQPAEAMTRGDITSRNILMEHGFSEREARGITLTSEPYVKGVSDLVRAKEPSSPIGILKRMALPFFRTTQNQVEQSFMRAPVLGFFAESLFQNAPRSLALKLSQQGIGAGVIGISYAAGAMAPKEQRTRLTKLLTNFAGPYGTLAAAGFMAGYKSQTEPDIAQQVIAGSTEAINALPLPTADSIIGMGKAGIEAMAATVKLALTGKIEEKDIPDLPFGFVPPLLSSKENLSIPSIMRDPKNFWSDSFRPTEKEYSLLAPFVQKPELKDLPLSKSETAKKDRDNRKRRATAEIRESRRQRRKELRNNRRASELNQQ